MCLAVPLRLNRIFPDRAAGLVDMGGAEREVGLDLVPEARPGDYVLVHAGMAIEVIEEEEADKTLDVLRRFALVPGMLEPGEGGGEPGSL